MHNRLSCDSNFFPRKKLHVSHVVFRGPWVVVSRVVSTTKGRSIPVLLALCRTGRGSGLRERLRPEIDFAFASRLGPLVHVLLLRTDTLQWVAIPDHLPDVKSQCGIPGTQGDLVEVGSKQSVVSSE